VASGISCPWSFSSETSSPRACGRKVILLVLAVPLAIPIKVIKVFAAGMYIVNNHTALAQNLFHDLYSWLAFMMSEVILRDKGD